MAVNCFCVLTWTLALAGLTSLLAMTERVRGRLNAGLEIDGILCSPSQPEEVRGLSQALDKGPLSYEEEEYMIWLSSLVHPQVMA